MNRLEQIKEWVGRWPTQHSGLGRGDRMRLEMIELPWLFREVEKLERVLTALQEGRVDDAKRMAELWI